MPVLLAAPFVQVFIALAIMLLAWSARTLLVKPLVWLLQNVPVVGYSIGQAVGEAIGAVIDWALDWAKDAVRPLVELVAVPINAIVAFVNMLASTAETIAGAIISVATVAAGQIGAVADRLVSLIHQVAGLADVIGAIRSAITTLSNAIAAVITSTIPAAINAVQAWARTLVANAVAAAEKLLRGLIDAIRPWVLLAIAAAVKPIQAAIDAIRPWVLAAVAVAVRPLELGLETLGKALTDAVGAILARLAMLEKLLPLLLLVPLAGTIVRTVEEFWRTKKGCVDPTCDVLGTILNGLGPVGELLTGSVLVYLVAESINDPEGAAREVQGWHDELASLASEVTGVLAGRPV